MTKVLGLIISFLVFPQILFAVPGDLRQSCYEMQVDGYNAETCIYSFPDSSKDTLVYHLHAGGRDAKTWIKWDVFTKLRNEWKRQNLRPPTFVTISFGPIWLLKDFSSDAKRPLIEVYNGIQSAVEKNLISIGYGPVNSRIILGESMGGINSILALALGNKDLPYQKAAILCAAVAPIGPYSAKEEIESYIQRHRNNSIEPAAVQNILVSWLGQEYPSAELWKKYNSLKLFGEIPALPGDIYISANTDDLLGLSEGNKTLYEIGRGLHKNVEFKLVPGPHCAYEYSSLAKFLGTAY
ncbi:MAG: hypothetical protein WC204_10070 [Elusimicrobiales bacterium]